ncbi:YHYH protein [bacterium]|nr:YHYH protein [bacterium]
MKPLSLLSLLLFFGGVLSPHPIAESLAPGRPPHGPPPHRHPPSHNTTNEDAKPRVSITVQGHWRIINSNGIPSHDTGSFPNRGNPNAISAQSYTYRVPLHPTPAPSATPLGQHPFGVAINGVPFDPNTAEWWNNDPQSGWHIEAFTGATLGMDDNNAHVQPTGGYHYHALPTGLVESLEGSLPMIVGWAADGYPITTPWGYTDPLDSEADLVALHSGYTVKTGTRPSGPGGIHDGTYAEDWIFTDSGNLDEKNGRFAVLPEFPEGTYHYVITDSWPFIPRSFRGTPNESFLRHGPPGGNRRPPPPHTR